MATARFLGKDSVGQGYWISGPTKRGKSGYYFAQYVSGSTYAFLQSFPSYVSSVVFSSGVGNFPASGTLTNTWLEQPGGGASKRSALWYIPTNGFLTMTATITATDNAPHILSLYFFESTAGTRKQVVSIMDGSTTLASYDFSVINEFANGAWLPFVVTGSVVVSVYNYAGFNPQISGFFWDEPVAGISGPTDKYVQSAYAF